MSVQKEENRIHLLQDNLKTIRLICGWTLDDLGKRLGVTKQTISRLENKKVIMNRTMYIAVRAVLDEKCSENNNDILRRALPILLREGEGEKLSEKEYIHIRKTLETIAAASSGNADKGILSSILARAVSFIPSLAVGSVVGSAATPTLPGIALASVFPWLTRLLNDSREKDKTGELKEPD
jgi:transcriptional regulator with XRE-family HTH domain